MYVERRPTLSRIRLVRDAFAAYVKGTVVRLLERVSDKIGDGDRGYALVRNHTECKLSDSYREGFEAGRRGYRRGSRAHYYVTSPVNEPLDLNNWQRSPIVLPASGHKAVECRADVARGRHTRGRRVRSGASERTSKREEIHLAGRCRWCSKPTGVPNWVICLSCVKWYDATKRRKAGRVDRHSVKKSRGGKSQ